MRKYVPVTLRRNNCMTSVCATIKTNNQASLLSMAQKICDAPLTFVTEVCTDYCNGSCHKSPCYTIDDAMSPRTLKSASVSFTSPLREIPALISLC